jgi:hypothetical protein
VSQRPQPTKGETPCTRLNRSSPYSVCCSCSALAPTRKSWQAPPDNRPRTYHDETLEGNGTIASPLGLADGAVTAVKLATATPPASGQVLTFNGSGLSWQSTPDALPAAGATTTTLLFPFVTNQAGFDTGIAISNTSADAVGTPHQQGKCKIDYFGNTTGGGAAPASQTTSTDVQAGSQLVFTLSSGSSFGIAATPGFQGYIIATCNFQYAHGIAFTSRLGGQDPSIYLALVIPEGARNPKGEQLSH